MGLTTRPAEVGLGQVGEFASQTDSVRFVKIQVRCLGGKHQLDWETGPIGVYDISPAAIRAQSVAVVVSCEGAYDAAFRDLW